MADKKVAAGTRLKAAAFIADRGGLPIASELSVSSLSVVHAIYAKHVGPVADAVKALPAATKGSQLSAPDRVASSARERESWAALMPAARVTPAQAVDVSGDE